MGDRVLFQVFNNPASIGEEDLATFGPVIYAHWSGGNAQTVCRALKRRMNSRPNDVEYTSARLVQDLIGVSEKAESGNENTGFGLWNADKLLTQEDSHGDAGVILVDVSEPKMKFLCMGGYLVVGKDGLPTENSSEEVTEEQQA